jgi:putative SOS response-associated peptidase YedK
MPVILPTREAEQAWLDPTLPQEEVLDLCSPINAALMDAYTVSRIITTKIGNVAEAVDPHPYPELNKTTLFG